jgi:hypothetical protein
MKILCIHMHAKGRCTTNFVGSCRASLFLLIDAVSVMRKSINIVLVFSTTLKSHRFPHRSFP